MQRIIKFICVMAAFTLIAVACSSGDSSEPGGDESPGAEAGSLAEFGESTDADPALIEKALGPVDVATMPEIVLASIARAEQDLDQATIDKALECLNKQQCDTGTGGDLIMGYADGGEGNVWRRVTRMEAILQALTYDDIGKMMFRDAQWDEDPAVAAGDIDYLVQAGASFIIGYPDQGTNIADAILAAEAADVPYISFSAGYVGLPGVQDGALIPGEDYTAVVGEDLCALGESFAGLINEHAGNGPVGILGGTPGNALSEGWQRCFQTAVNNNVKTLGPEITYWDNATALNVVNGWLSKNPNITGFAYEYADGLDTALQAYDDLDIKIDDLTVVLRTDEQTLFCTWRDMDNPNFNIWFSAGGNFQSRVAVTAAMLHLQDYEIPPEIIVPHVMRQVTADDCDDDRATPTVSGTSLVPDEVLALMYQEG